MHNKFPVKLSRETTKNLAVRGAAALAITGLASAVLKLNHKLRNGPSVDSSGNERAWVMIDFEGDGASTDRQYLNGTYLEELEGRELEKLTV